MISELASTLQTMSAPVERRLEMLDQAVRLFDRIDSTSRGGSDPGRAEVQVRAEIKTELKLARALQELGDPQTAIGRAKMAESRAEKLLKLDAYHPENQQVLADALFEKSRARFKMGGALKVTPELDQAIGLLRPLSELKLPDDLHVSIEAVLCDSLVLKAGTGDRLVQPELVTSLLSEATKHGENAYEAESANPNAVDSYASSMENLGAFYFDRGDAELFRVQVEKALALRRDAAEKAPSDIALQRAYDRALGRWGCCLAYVNPSDENRDLPAKSVAVLRGLLAVDPNNVQIEQDFVQALETYGTVLQDRYQYQDAIKLLREAVDIAGRVIEERKATRLIKDYFRDAALNLAHCYLKVGDLEAAKKINSELILPLAQEHSGAQADSADYRFFESYSCYLQGEIDSRSAEPKIAHERFLRALSLLQENLRVRTFSGDQACYGCLLTKVGQALANLGENESARQYIERGLQVMYSLRGSQETLLRGELSADISEAEDQLRRCREELDKMTLSQR
jgi:tetratricopeptide (TPR) repeat protein